MLGNQLKPNIIIILILVVFLLKGVFLSTIFPVFEGQDEARHYNTIQLLNESSHKSIKFDSEATDADQDKKDLSTYRFSEEIRKTAKITENHILRSYDYNTIVFSKDFFGINEGRININNAEALNKVYPPDATGKNGQNLYHMAGSIIENNLASKSILERFYSIRIFSVFIATLSILFFHLSILKVGFTNKNSLFLSSIIAFHPNYTFYTTNINYAPFIIFAFSLFTYGSILYLKSGLNWKNLFLMFISIIIGMWTKGTAIVLIIILLLILARESYLKLEAIFKNSNIIKLSISVLVATCILFFFGKYLPTGLFSNPAKLLISFWEYAMETLTIGKFSQSSSSYWGLIGWTDSFIVSKARELIWLIQAFAVVGLGIYFFSKKELPKFLPEKKYTTLLLIMIVVLQLGVRLADWRYFERTGNIGLGAPGRYFLPNVMSHIVLIYVGLGMLLSHFKKETYFEISLKIGLISVFSLSMYIIFNVIIYRYYLL